MKKMKTLYLWEKIVLAIVATASFFAGLDRYGLPYGLIDAVMALSINTLITFGLFVIGNKVFRKKK